MSATATRPPDQRNPMMDEEGLVWLHHSGVWIGIPEDANGELLQRALSSLEWMASPPDS